MILSTTTRSIEFSIIPLVFLNRNIERIFSKKNNRTLRYTLDHKRYAKVSNCLGEKYQHKTHMPLGEFMDGLISLENDDYKLFLNKYGHHKFCEFEINQYLDRKGLYCFIVDSEIKYVGRCTDNFKKRINHGYGKIHPKNCYIDGQATNCHINHLINLSTGEIRMGIYDMSSESNLSIKNLEEEIIRNNRLNWNIQLQK